MQQLAQRNVEEESKCPVPGIVSQVLHNLLNMLSGGKKSREPFTIRVSEAVSCLRKSYFHIVFGSNIDNLPMAVGRYLHNLAFSIIQNIEKQEETEILVEPRIVVELFPNTTNLKYRMWKLVAEPDIMIKSREETHVIELKFQLGKVLGKDIIEKYLNQVSTYVALTEAAVGHLVVVKSDLSILHKVVTREEARQRYQTVLSRARELVKHLVKRKIPEPENGTECKYCPFREMCRQ